MNDSRFATVAVALLVGLAALGAAPTAQANHNVCPNSHWFTAPVGGTVDANDPDYWAHNSAGGTHRITLQPSGGDADLYVYGSACEYLCSSLNWSTDTDSCDVDYAGTLIVLVQYYACEGAGCDAVSYSLSQSHVESPAGACLGGDADGTLDGLTNPSLPIDEDNVQLEKSEPALIADLGGCAGALVAGPSTSSGTALAPPTKAPR